MLTYSGHGSLMQGLLLHTSGTGTRGEFTHPVVHVACSHELGLQSALICVCVRCVYTHPDALLHESIVHELPSLHTVVVLVQLPVAELHANCSHKSFVGHVTLAVYAQALPEQVSVVQRLSSLQIAAVAVAFFLRVPHPVDGEHVASRHLSAGSEHTRAVYTHALLQHVSIVHSSLSLHCSAMAVGVFSSKTHPSLTLHPAVLQMSSDGHNAPRSVASQDPAPVALHAYVVQSVSAGHGVFESSAQYRRGVPDVTFELQAAC